MLPALLEESGSTSRLLRMRGGLGMGLLVAICSLSLSGSLGCGGGERQDEDEPEGEFPIEIVSAEFPAKQRLAETAELTLTVANVGDETIPDLAVTAFTEEDTEVAIDAEGAESANPDDESATDASGEEIPEEELGSAVDQALQEELEEDAGGTTEESGDETSADDAELDQGTSTEQTLPQADGAFSVISEQEGLAIPSRPVWILEEGYPRIADTEAAKPPPGELSGAGGADAAQTNTFSFGSLEPNQTREVVWQVTPVQAGTFTVHYRIAAGLQGKAVAVNQDGSVPEGEFVVRITDVPPQTRVDDNGKVVPIQKSDIIGQAGSSKQKSELDGQ